MRASDAKLAAALREAGLPEHAKRAAEGWFNEFFGRFPAPQLTLVHDLVIYGKHDLAERVRNGEFDAGKEEADEWARSEEGQRELAAMEKLIPNVSKREQ
jgi:hypothetical protein